MKFESGHLFHIYNQGNNRQRIFFERDNYLLFLHKIRDYVLPLADILAWCLMPNHFHLMVYVNQVGVTRFVVNNPVKDGLAKRAEDWEFSSYSDFIGIRNGKQIRVC